MWPLLLIAGAIGIGLLLYRYAQPSPGYQQGANVPGRISDVSRLDAETQRAWSRVKARLIAKGHTPWVFETLRTPERQLSLAGADKTGRTPLVGKRGEGHRGGRALDVIDGRPHPDPQKRSKGWRVGWGSDGDPTAKKLADQFFDDLADAAEAEGFTAGRRWTAKYGPDGDAPHIELPPRSSSSSVS